MPQPRKTWTAPRVVVLATAVSAENGGGPFPDGGGEFTSGIPG